MEFRQAFCVRPADARAAELVIEETSSGIDAAILKALVGVDKSGNTRIKQKKKVLDELKGKLTEFSQGNLGEARILLDLLKIR